MYLQQSPMIYGIYVVVFFAIVFAFISVLIWYLSKRNANKTMHQH